mmetsp:Transcript_14656/g.41803  ORF Transcript_14656/g.41803 Transcript_14656/m.41803 type:complete len:107 (-) Transcript_14656:304-624(-)
MSSTVVAALSLEFISIAAVLAAFLLMPLSEIFLVGTLPPAVSFMIAHVGGPGRGLSGGSGGGAGSLVRGGPSGGANGLIGGGPAGGGGNQPLGAISLPRASTMWGS